MPSPPVITRGSGTTGDGRLHDRARRRPGQGPELRGAHARPGPAGPHDVPGRRPAEVAGPATGRPDRPAHRRQARQPGRVLHHVDAAADARRSSATASRSIAPRSSTPPVSPSARSRRSSWSRSASARASASRAAAPSATSSTSTPRHAWSRSATTPTCSARASTSTSMTWVDGDRSTVTCSCSAAPTATRARDGSPDGRRRGDAARRLARAAARVAPGQSVVLYDLSDTTRPRRRHRALTPTAMSERADYRPVRSSLWACHRRAGLGGRRRPARRRGGSGATRNAGHVDRPPVRFGGREGEHGGDRLGGLHLDGVAARRTRQVGRIGVAGARRIRRICAVRNDTVSASTTDRGARHRPGRTPASAD